MARYKVLSLLWSPSRNEYLEPGEVVDLDDGIGGVLMNKGVVEPAIYRTKVERVEVEDNGPDN